MKNYLMLLGLFFSLLLSAQTPLPIMPKPTEPDVPTVIEAEAAEFLKTFEKLVQYLADKNNNYTDKVYHAQIFAKKFKQGAVIEIKNGKRTIPLTPLEYFHRLIDLKYDQVVIKFENIKNNGIKRTVQNQYKSQYLIKGTSKNSCIVKN